MYNNTGSDIQFAASGYVLDDAAGGNLSAANVTSGSLDNLEVGVLFNSANLSESEMQDAWGGGINFIPVVNWPQLNNGGDTIGLWSSLAGYQGETMDESGRSTGNAAAAVVYDDVVAEGWPNDDGESSIFWNDWSAEPELGESWTLSGSADDALGSSTAAPIIRTVVDHPGEDVASPGFVPGVGVLLFGDYNGDLVVGPGDYTVWRNHLGEDVTLPNEDPMTTPGSVTIEDYEVWKAHYGDTPGGGASITGSVPEPATLIMAMLCAASFLAGSGIRQRSALPWLSRRVGEESGP